MRPYRRPDTETAATVGLASLTDIPLRREALERDKKSDITDALASVRTAPQFIRPDDPVPKAPMRDVTPPAQGDIVAFWDVLRGNRPMPDFDAVRPSEIAARWPHLILFRCESEDDLRPDTAFSTVLRAHRWGTGGGTLDGGVVTTAMVSQWILANARDAVVRAAPVRDRSGFETPSGRVQYDLAAVPFGIRSVDRVLCSIECLAT